MLIIGSGILQIYINNDIISAYNYYIKRLQSKTINVLAVHYVLHY